MNPKGDEEMGMDVIEKETATLLLFRKSEQSEEESDDEKDKGKEASGLFPLRAFHMYLQMMLCCMM